MVKTSNVRTEATRYDIPGAIGNLAEKVSGHSSLGKRPVGPLVTRQTLARAPRRVPAARDAIETLGLHVADQSDGFLIVTGSETLGEYAEFRLHQLSLIEVGVLDGYTPTAVIAFSDILETEATQPWPTTAAEYSLGGRFSKDFAKNERATIALQCSEIEQVAPAIASIAEGAFLASTTEKAA